MENAIEYLYEGVRYIHKYDTLEIIFEDDIQEKMQNGDLPKDHFSWEVISFCRDELVAYDKASSTKSGFKLNIFDYNYCVLKSVNKIFFLSIHFFYFVYKFKFACYHKPY